MMYYTSLESFIKKYERLSRGDRMDTSSKEAFLSWQEEAKARLSSILALDLLEKPQSLEPAVLDKKEIEKGITRVHMTIKVEEDVTMPFYILTPQTKKNNDIFICAPGHQGGGKESLAGDTRYPDVVRMTEFYNYDFALRLAGEGYTSIAFDSRGFGERRETDQQGDDKILLSSCNALSHMAEPLGFTLAGLLVWDVMRLIDYVQTLKPERINMIGFSGGGLQTLYASALDERIDSAFISGYFYGYRDALLILNGNCACNYVPSLWRHFEISDIAAMIAPRTLIIQSAEGDHLNGPRGLDNVLPYVEEVRKAYSLLTTRDLPIHCIIPGGHHFDWQVAKDAYIKAGVIDA